MNRLKMVIVGSILALLVAACSQQVSEPTATSELAAASPTANETHTPEPEPTATETVAPTPTETVPPTATLVPTPVPTDTPEPAQVADACLTCHMDKDQLIQTASPVEEAPSESSGVG